MGREKESRMAKSQSKAGMGIAYRQINERGDVEKSVQSWNRTAYRQRKVSEDAEKSVQSRHGDSLWADKRERGWRKISPKLV